MKTKEVSGNISSSDKQFHFMRRRRFLRRFPGVLCLGPLLLSLAVNVHGEFVAPYALTPPVPGSYLVTDTPFGDWRCVAPGRGLRVDTTFTSTNLVLDTQRVISGVGGYFYTRAAAAGTVSFEYTITGEGTGSLSWYNNGPDSPFATTDNFLASVTNLVAVPATASFHVEADDYFGFYLSAVGRQMPTPQNAQRRVTIGNFVAPEPVVGLPTISIHDVIVAEPTNGIANAVFAVRLSAAHTQAVSVAYFTTNVTATAGSDYQGTSGTLTFGPGETNKTISVTVLADAINEGTETFLAVLSTPTNATLAKSQATCTINELRITALTFDVNISFNSVNQAIYRVEWSEDGTNWSAVPGSENVPGTGNMVTVTHANAACNPSRLYRVLLLQ